MRTFSFTGTDSVLSADFYPPIDLREYEDVDDENGGGGGGGGEDFALGFLSLEVYNSIPNIYIGKNKFYIDNHTLEIPTGTYDIKDINSNLLNQIDLLNKIHKKHMILSIHPNLNTLKCEIKCTHVVDFSKPDSIGDLLGFESKILDVNKLNESKKPVNIMKVNAIKVLCNIITGSYDNGVMSHILHEFFPSVGAGFKIIESPQNVIYLPLNTKIINNITFKLVDQDGKLLNFRGETITLRTHLRAVDRLKSKRKQRKWL